MPFEIFAWEPPFLLIHGGAGECEKSPSRAAKRRAFLEDLSCSLRRRLAEGNSAFAVTSAAVLALEESGLFNAGCGSARQCDGSVRVTASCMESGANRFSGVALVTHVTTPSRLAIALQSRADRVLGPLGAQLLARELSLPIQVAYSAESAEQWMNSQQSALEEYPGTVGAVAVDRDGLLAAMTSTGGTGPTNFPERMSDVATVAGNYCTPYAAISCSGIGEQIVDLAVAARIETRLRDGAPLTAVAERILQEASAVRSQLGAIVVTPAGAAVLHSTPAFAVAGGDAGHHSTIYPVNL